MDNEVCPLLPRRPQILRKWSLLPHKPAAEFPLNAEADAVWACANILKASHQRDKVEPEHLALALLYGQINDIDEPATHLGPILDVPLFWTAFLRAGGHPAEFGRDLRNSAIEPRSGPSEAEPECSAPVTTDWGVHGTGSARTYIVLRCARTFRDMFNDFYIAPYHIVLALLKDKNIHDVFVKQRISERNLVDIIEGFRGPRILHKMSEPRFEMLNRFAIDLTELAKDKKIGPVVGRDDEIRRLVCILSRRTKNSAVLLGEPGVGKTAVAEGLALRIVNRETPACLNGRVFSLDMRSLLAGTACHGQYEARVEALLDEVERNETIGISVIIYIDEIHLIMTGRMTGGSGGLDAGNLMKPFLARGKLRCFGSTTYAEFSQSIERDSSLTRRFTQIVVCEPTVREAVTMLRGLREDYQKHHGVEITNTALTQAATLGKRYFRLKRLPDSAIDLVDEGCAGLRIVRETKPEAIAQLEDKKYALKVDIDSLTLEQDDESSMTMLKHALERRGEVENQLKALCQKHAEVKIRRAKIAKTKGKIATNERKEAHLREVGYVRQAEKISDEIRTLKIELDTLLGEKADEELVPARVCPLVIAEVVHRITNIPMANLMRKERPMYIHVSDYLSKTVVGQPEAVEAVSSAVHTSQSGLVDPTRPFASFMFTGCSGTGKTLLARALAKFLLHEKDALVVINGSEYASEISLTRLIGTSHFSPDGYAGQLTECIKRRPFSIVLVDEIDKACSAFHNRLLGILDDGCLADGDDMLVDFRNCIIIMTSNVGAEYLTEDGAISKDTRNLVMKSIKRHFSPEFLSRVDETVIFRRLSSDKVREIVKLSLKEIEETQLASNRLKLEVDEPSMTYLQRVGYNPLEGARRLMRLIQSEIVNPLSDFLLDERIMAGDVVQVRYNPVEKRLYLLANHKGACFAELD